MKTEFWEIARKLSEDHESFVVVTLVSARGSTPADPGSKAIVMARGILAGTVGGGKVEARAIERARQLLETREAAPELVTWNLQRDIGMTCGGEVSLLFEIHRSDGWEIAVYGAGHVAQALIRALEPIHCKLTCIDPRAEWIARLPPEGRMIRRCVPDPAATVREFSSRTFFVVMTQGHATDMPILEAIFRTHPDAPYVGVMGSDVKSLRMRKELRERGIPDNLIERLRCPIGLPLGGNAPAEIALSVAAELLQLRPKTWNW